MGTVQGLRLSTPSAQAVIGSLEAKNASLKRRWFRWTLSTSEVQVRLRGMSKGTAQEISLVLRRLAINDDVQAALDWASSVSALLERHSKEQRWIPSESIERLVQSAPGTEVTRRIEQADAATLLSTSEKEAVQFLGADVRRLAAEQNQRILDAELFDRRSFFDGIEKSPMTDEQARAVVCFDNRVQLLAAAGSGKTSVMVARAAYAVSREFIKPDRILLLAFNKKAADELQERVTDRFAAAGIPSAGIRATTFHSFGLSLLGRATGRKPRVASWLEHGDGQDMVLRIADELRDESEEFRYAWDVFRLLLAPAPVNLTDDEPDAYDKEKKTSGFETMKGDIVRSHGERLIADFLYLNGVNYLYEHPYTVDVSAPEHGQYRPDFYYPDIGVWHEHWAVDRTGNPPPEFEGYADGMAWKRRLHKTNKTELIETSWGEVVFGDGLSRLAGELRSRGLTLDWNPDRPVRAKWFKVTRHEDMARLVRTFMSHVKSNSWTADQLQARLETELRHRAGFRTDLFLRLYWQVQQKWDEKLSEDNSVDFEDMLIRAAHHLESGSVDADYDLVLVDEFQDASHARARLVRGLVSKPDTYLLAVGDDWQSINRFAGADLSVMTAFDRWFGEGQQLALTKTFRCTQTIANTARAFVTKNPAQFGKNMVAASSIGDRRVELIQTDATPAAVAAFLQSLSEHLASADVEGEKPHTASVFLLGRYRFERDNVPRRTPPNLSVTFQTVHSSKGLEADYVIIPGMTTGTYGFPSTIRDDPVLDVAMPAPESFPHAEERRLFYVALTRARRHVVLMAPTSRISPFVLELVEDGWVNDSGAGHQVELCGCKRGIRVRRSGPHGPFLGCSTFPACAETMRID